MQCCYLTYDFYITGVHSCLSLHKDLELDSQYCLRTARWLLTSVMNTFEKSIKIHRMESRRKSFLLIHDSIDIRNALHDALATCRLQHIKLNNSNYVSPPPNTCIPTTRSKETLVMSLNSILPELNSRLKLQSSKLTEYYKLNPLSVINFNYLELLKMLDPTIFKLVSYLTMSDNEQKHVSDFPLDTYVLSDLKGNHARHQLHRRINIILMMHFVLNESNNYPVHIVIANCIQRLSHSSKLLQLLNQAGLCVSRDTLTKSLVAPLTAMSYACTHWVPRLTVRGARLVNICLHLSH